MAVHVNQTESGGAGTNTLTRAAGISDTVHNLTWLEISFAGPTRGPNAMLTIYDGDTSGTVIHRTYLDQPTGSVGFVQLINIPKDARGNPSLQATPGNAMTIVVNGYGANRCSINAKFGDGLQA